MLISRLNVENFKKFRQREVTFSPGINILQGPNGSGKTSILEGVEFSLFGSVTGMVGLAPIVRLGEVLSEASLTFMVDGEEHTILRQVSKGETGASSSKTLLTREGSELSSKKSEIDGLIEDLVGLDQSTYRNSCYIRQGEIRSLLEAGKEREREIDRMIGLGVFEDVWKDLRKTESSLEGKLAQAREELIRAEAELENLESVSKELSKRMEEKVEAKAEMKRAKEELENSGGSVPDISRSIGTTSEAKVATQRQKLQSLRDRKSEIEERIDSANERLMEMEAEILRRENRVESLKEERTSIVERKDKIERDIKDNSESLEEIEQEILSLETDLDLQKSMIDAFSRMEAGDDLVCPVCGSELTREHAREARGELDSKIRRYQEEIEEKERDRQRFKQAVDAFQSRSSRLQKQLDEIEKEISQAQSENSGVRVSKEEIESQIGSDLQRKRDLEAEMENVSRELDGLESQAPLDVDSADTSEPRARYLANKRILERLEEEIPTLVDRLGQEQMKKTQLASAQDRHSQIESALRKIKDIRWAFNNIGPYARKRILPTVEKHAKELFDSIYSGDFIDEIELTKDYDIRAQTGAGELQSELLSVGEKVMAGLSLRLALSRIHQDTASKADAREPGFLVLDEPTEYLDQSNVRNLADTLSQLTSFGQIVIVTHDNELTESIAEKVEINKILLS